MSRTKNVKNNLIFNTIKYIMQLLLQFVLQTVLLKTLGKEYAGLKGLFTNIFTFLNLAELGIGSAIVFSMYKPIAENDIEKIKALQNLYKKFYLIISGVVFAIGLLLLPFLKYLIKGGLNANVNIYILFVMYLINSLVGYFSAHKRSLLFAYERNDIENKIRTVCLFSMTILQIAVLFLFKNYYVFFAINIVFTFVECIWIQIVANKKFPEINGKSQPLDKETKKEISKNVYALSLHKIGTAVVFSTDNILISALFGAILVGAYSNYYLIINALVSIFTIISNAITASVGNLIASENIEYVYKKFKNVNFIYYYLSYFCTICLFCLFQPFMKVWNIFAGNEIVFLEMSTVLLLCISFYLSRMRGAVMVMKTTAGLFMQDRWKPIVEACVNLVVSILLGYFIGINGIVLGTIISTISAPLWIEPHVLYKYYFKKSTKGYWLKYIFYTFIMIAVGAITFYLCSLVNVSNILDLIFKGLICLCLPNLIFILIFIKTEEFDGMINIFKSLIKKKS